jgi:hypothetical protein
MLMSSLQLKDLSERNEEEEAHTVLVSSKLGHSTISRQPGQSSSTLDTE